MDKLVAILVCIFLSFSAKTMESENIPPKSYSIIVSTIASNQLVSWYKRYVVKAYNDIGYKVTIVEHSPKKSAEEGNKGNIDAVVIRVSEIEDNLIDFQRVPTIIAKGKLVLYCQKNVICNDEVLNNRHNLIGIVSGVNITSNYMKNKNASTYQVETDTNVAMMLNKKRFDYILSVDVDDLGNYSDLVTEDYNRIVIKELVGYHYVHKSISGLIPELTTSLANAIEEIGPPQSN